MNKDKALIALQEGKKLTHVTFQPHEWLVDSGGRYTFEDGMSSSSVDFWQIRTEAIWSTGWSFWNPNT